MFFESDLIFGIRATIIFGILGRFEGSRHGQAFYSDHRATSVGGFGEESVEYAMPARQPHTTVDVNFGS